MIEVSETDFRNLLNELYELRRLRDELQLEMKRMTLKHLTEMRGIGKGPDFQSDQCPIYDEHNNLVGYSRRI